ncbi:MAG: hypothetical protein ACREBO_08225 [Novosphingobium sp.]
MAAKASSARKPRTPTFAQWSKVFLAELAATSNVTAAAKKAKAPISTVYDARRNRPEFNRAWFQALCEGYAHLEMELLHRLRTGEVKPAAGAKKGVRTFDNAIALRQLAAHKESVGRAKAVRSHADAEAIVQSINAKLEQMRQRRLAAAQRVIDAEPSTAE